MPKKTSKQTPQQTQKKKKTDKKPSPEELRDKRSHKGGELNTWDPAQLPIAHELWKSSRNQATLANIIPSLAYTG